METFDINAITEEKMKEAVAFFERKAVNGKRYYEKNKEKCLQKGKERRERMKAEGIKKPRAKRVLSDDALARKRESSKRARVVDPLTKEQRLIREKEKRAFMKAAYAEHLRLQKAKEEQEEEAHAEEKDLTVVDVSVAASC